MLRPAGTTAVGRGFAGAPAIVGVGVPAVLRAWPVAAGAASGSAWACVSVLGWVATAAGGAASHPCRVVRRVRRCHSERWAGRARWCRRRLPWRVGGRGETHRTPGSGRVPCRFGLRCRSRGSMRLLRIGAVGCSPAWCTGRSGRRGGVGVARAVSRHWRGWSRVGSDVGGQPGPGQQGSRLLVLVWGQARVCSAVDGRGSGLRRRAARLLQARRLRRGPQWLARWRRGPWRWPHRHARRGAHRRRLSGRRCQRGRVRPPAWGWTCR